jgi:spore germination protein
MIEILGGVNLEIYVVKVGDSIWSLSRRFRVTQESILEANGLQAEDQLVVGQALVIPSVEIRYIVKDGDSLSVIARRFRISENDIRQINGNINFEMLRKGMIIRIPEKKKNYGYIEVNGFIQPSNAQHEREVLRDTIEFMTYISPFSHQIKQDASLTQLDDDTITNIAVANKVAPLLSITNISGANFDTALIHKILSDNSLQQKLIGNILTLLKAKRYLGVIIDFERIPPEDRELYNNFLRKVVLALHPNYMVATALAPKTYDIKEGSWHGAHDYKAHGQIVDFSVIMTYEWGWSGGPPMAVAPLNEVEKVINFALSVMPAKKIMMGMPLYGYDWTLPYVPGGEFAESIGNDEAVRRAAKYNAEIKYDIKAQSPFYNYIDENRRQHQVWFEDARSVMAKYRLVNRLGLRGVSYWVLAQPFVQNFYVLDNMFHIVKVMR